MPRILGNCPSPRRERVSRSRRFAILLITGINRATGVPCRLPREARASSSHFAMLPSIMKLGAFEGRDRCGKRQQMKEWCLSPIDAGQSQQENGSLLHRVVGGNIVGGGGGAMVGRGIILTVGKVGRMVVVGGTMVVGLMVEGPRFRFPIATDDPFTPRLRLGVRVVGPEPWVETFLFEGGPLGISDSDRETAFTISLDMSAFFVPSGV